MGTTTANDLRIWASLNDLDRAQLYAQGSRGVPDDLDPRALVAALLKILRREVRDRERGELGQLDLVRRQAHALAKLREHFGKIRGEYAHINPGDYRELIAYPAEIVAEGLGRAR